MTQENDEINLTPAELHVLSGLDSELFGFFHLNAPQHAKKKAIVVKAIKQLEKVLAQAQQIKEQNRRLGKDEKALKEIQIDPKTYCKLGHFHLLLEDYTKAMSAYQKFYQLKEDFWRDPSFLYGQGLVYFHFNAFQWAIKSFQQLLYIDTGWKRSNEVHLRLGLMFKVQHDIGSSLKHFQLALNDTSPCTFSKLEIRFHIAHLYEIRNKYKVAKESYEKLLAEPSLPDHLKADIYRQLGWMHHTVESLGEASERDSLAIQYLQRSIEADPKSGQSLYLLGRCFSSVGKVHDAFLAYRNSVDKSEANADTWCSIGVLYQQQNQPMDALQAYICAVQLDKTHVAAWTNLGILYETCSQPKDALACYVNAQRGSSKQLSPNLQARIKFLQGQLANAPSPSVTAKSRPLPGVEEAWNMPISAEMTARQQQTQQRMQQYQGGSKTSFQNPPPPYPSPSEPNKRFKAEPVEPVVSMALMQQPPRVSLQQPQYQQPPYSTASVPYRQPYPQISLPSCDSNDNFNFAQDGGLPKDLTNISINIGSAPTVSEKDIQDILSNKDIATSVAEDLLKQFAQGGLDLDLKDESLLGEDPKTDDSVLEVKNEVTLNAVESEMLVKVKSEEEPPASSVQPEVTPEPNTTTTISTASEASPIIVNEETSCSIKTERKRDPSSLLASTLSINLTAAQLQQACKGQGKSGVISTSILPEGAPPPAPPKPPPKILSREELLPQTPSVLVTDKKECASPMLQEFCYQHPIAVIRGMAQALKLDLGLFSTKVLVEAHPEHQVEIRTQVQQGSDENWDPVTGKPGWRCESHRSHTTVAKYATYQAQSFQDSLKEEQERNANPHKDEDKDLLTVGKRKGRTLHGKKIIRFGTNVDLSCESKWRPQIQELQKMPAFVRLVSASNMLSHVGHVILGMNTLQLYMKVPGSRTPGHQENNNFCALNFNIGPGDSEWFATPDEYWGALSNLCEKNGVNYLHGSWWPTIDELIKNNIPVYRFLQKPGDLVWINAGCVHWVQSAGWCNNVAWNVGPLTASQYRLAIERYEWNKLQHYKSIVPMVHLSWNFARNIKVSEPKLFETIKHTLMRSLRQVFLTLEFIQSHGVDLRFHGRGKNEASHYCWQCDNEVFNILFVKEQEKRHVVHCHDCARKVSPRLEGFVCLEEYKLQELKQVYDGFILHPPAASSS